MRSTFSPYLVGGVGWYRQKVDQLQGDQVLSTTVARRTGFQAGLGGEIWLGRRATVHADYRYAFIQFGKTTQDAEPGAVPVPGLQGLQERLRLSHKGSMWTSGVTVYF